MTHPVQDSSLSSPELSDQTPHLATEKDLMAVLFGKAAHQRLWAQSPAKARAEPRGGWPPQRPIPLPATAARGDAKCSHLYQHDLNIGHYYLIIHWLYLEEKRVFVVCLSDIRNFIRYHLKTTADQGWVHNTCTHIACTSTYTCLSTGMSWVLKTPHSITSNDAQASEATITWPLSSVGRLADPHHQNIQDNSNTTNYCLKTCCDVHHLITVLGFVTSGAVLSGAIAPCKVSQSKLVPGGEGRVDYLCLACCHHAPAKISSRKWMAGWTKLVINAELCCTVKQFLHISS